MITTSANSFENIKEVIKVINELKDCGVESDKIVLPKIVVIGVQSSGKSSLLEQIVQLDFLPRGTGVVTRCPLEIRLIEVTNYDRNFKPYAYFYDQRSKIYENFEEVKTKIQTITDEKAGKGKMIVDETIVLTIYQTKCPTLTLIDLPGMTLNSIEDQVDIEKVTQDMTLKYIQEETTIILCVIPINQDLENSLALKLARNVDKTGNRTIGVLTMIDIMNPGTNCDKVLKNQQIPLKHRYYGMKPRNQKDINNKMTVEQAIQLEQEYFANHDVYRQYPDYTGTASLTLKLSTLLDSHIRHFLPSIYQKIQTTLAQRIQQRKKLGDPFPTNQREQQKELREIINKQLNLFNSILKTNHECDGSLDNIKAIQIEDRIGKTQIDYLMDKYAEKNRELFSQNLKKIDMKKALEQLQKYRIPVNGFLPIQSLETQVRKYIKEYEYKSHELLDSIKEYIKRVLNFCMDQFPLPNYFTRKTISDIIQKNVLKEFKSTKDHIQTTFECFRSSVYSRSIDVHGYETKIKQAEVTNSSNILQKKSLYEYITKHKNFMKWSIYDAVQISEQLQGKNISSLEFSDFITKTEEKHNTDEIFRYCLIFYTYMDNFSKQISDQIPQFIDTLFLQTLQAKLFINVVNSIESESHMETLKENLKEDVKLAKERKDIIKSLKQLSKAYQTLKSLQENSFDHYSSSISHANEELISQIQFEDYDLEFDEENEDKDKKTSVD